MSGAKNPLAVIVGGNILKEAGAKGLTVKVFAEKLNITESTMLAWLDTQGEDNNYMHNLKTACALRHDNGRNFGIIASLFPTWNRDLERQEQKRREQEAGKKSEWVGEVGKRVSLDVAEVKLLTSWETRFGCTCVWKIVVKDGNVYTWKTGNDIPEDAKKITGTVKEHKEYRGVKQTELTRCRVA